MLIVKNVAVIAAGNQNGWIWWVMKHLKMDKIQISKLVRFQFFLRPIFLLCQKFSSNSHPLVGRVKFQALSVLKNILFENLTLI